MAWGFGLASDAGWPRGGVLAVAELESTVPTLAGDAKHQGGRLLPSPRLTLQVTVSLVLLAMALCFVLVTALTVVLKVGNDG